jgi:hypothetical protein
MKLVDQTPEDRLLVSSEWSQGRPKRKHRLEVAAKRARFLVRAGARWVLLAETTRANARSEFDLTPLSREQREQLAVDLELLRKEQDGESWFEEYEDWFREATFAESLAQIADESASMKDGYYDVVPAEPIAATTVVDFGECIAERGVWRAA